MGDSLAIFRQPANEENTLRLRQEELSKGDDVGEEIKKQVWEAHVKNQELFEKFNKEEASKKAAISTIKVRLEELKKEKKMRQSQRDELEETKDALKKRSNDIKQAKDGKFEQLQKDIEKQQKIFEEKR